MITTKDLLFASGNQHKTAEIRVQIPSFIQLRCLADLGYLHELPETGNSLTANADQKARFVFDLYGVNVFAEDTGLEVFALNSEPGIYSARYAGPQRSAQDNMDLLLHKLSNLDAIHSNRAARFRTVISLIWEDVLYNFEGEVDGFIAYKPQGTEGFGYDPIFVPNEGDGRTFAEMSIQEKLHLSHRGRAVAGLIKFLADI